ncbi:unnamed protein product [Brachionus calyciflorus]|uniref:Uncharacterized protein n=1 Tax=Brachionus calyciflorus TaxID=104777 RepID=A0A813SBL6_9BILA|nr:unnamed protein product [Brachionus calyciflorus]
MFRFPLYENYHNLVDYQEYLEAKSRFENFFKEAFNRSQNRDPSEKSIEEQERELLKEEPIEIRNTTSSHLSNRHSKVFSTHEREGPSQTTWINGEMVNKVGSGPIFPTKTADWSLSTLSVKPGEENFFKNP